MMQQLLAYRLLSHLQFTTVLELEHVNGVCSKLARGCYELELSCGQKNDALRIYCDEGGHALFVELLSREVELLHQVDRRALGQARFQSVLARLFSEYGNLVHRDWLHLFFVCVSETLVSKILREIPRDPSVAPAVREVIGDHARDEGTHSVYFHWLFPKAWQTLTGKQQEVLGALLPTLLDAFLAPDTACDERVLQALGVSSQVRRRLLEQTYDPTMIRDNVRTAAQPTLRMFANAGIFERAGTFEAFAAADLYLESNQ
jgi:hypothetical protein